MSAIVQLPCGAIYEMDTCTDFVPISASKGAYRVFNCGVLMGMSDSGYIRFDMIKKLYRHMYNANLNKRELFEIFGSADPVEALPKQFFVCQEDEQEVVQVKLAGPENSIKAQLDMLLEVEMLAQLPLDEIDDIPDPSSPEEPREELIEVSSVAFDAGKCVDAVSEDHPEYNSQYSNPEELGAEVFEFNSVMFDGVDSEDDYFREYTSDDDDGRTSQYTFDVFEASSNPSASDDEQQEPEVELIPLFREEDLPFRRLPESTSEGAAAAARKLHISIVDNPLQLTRAQILSISFEQLEARFLKSKLPPDHLLESLPAHVYLRVRTRIDSFDRMNELTRSSVLRYFNKAKLQRSEDKIVDDVKLISQALWVLNRVRDRDAALLNEWIEGLFRQYLSGFWGL